MKEIDKKYAESEARFVAAQAKAAEEALNAKNGLGLEVRKSPSVQVNVQLICFFRRNQEMPHKL